MTTPPISYKIYSEQLGPMENFVYLIHDLVSDTAAIVDPAWDIHGVIDFAEQQQIKITDILLTHSHHDHINGLDDTLKRTDAKIHLLKQEAKFWGEPQTGTLQNTQHHHGGDIISVGESQIKILHTPGHTPGSACYHVGDDLIAGDTLFVFGCGRCDLAGGDPEQMFQTLKKMKTELAKNTCIHPGHNYAPQSPTSSWQEQCDGNPFLHFDHTADFQKYRMQVHDKIRDTPYSAVDKKNVLAQIK